MKIYTSKKVFMESWLYVILTIILGTLLITFTPYVAMNLTSQN